MWHGLMCYKVPARGRGHGAVSVCPNISKYYPEEDEGWHTVFNDLQPPAYTSHSGLCNVCLGENTTALFHKL